MRRARSRGQASVEALALMPLLVIAILIGWQLAALVRGAISAQELARERALRASGSGSVTVEAVAKVPSVLPGVDGFRIPVRVDVGAR